MSLTSKPFLSILDSVPTMLQTAMGINQINKGLSQELVGFNLASQSYRNAGQMAQATAQYNAQLQELALKQQLNSAGRNIDKVLGEQRTTEASSGFALTSKSFLQVANDSLSTFEREIVNARNTTAQQQQSTLFSGKLAQYQANTQAAVQQYQGEVAKYQAAVSGAKGYGSLAKQGLTLLGDIYNG